MKITVKHEETEIIVDESDNNEKDTKASLRWENQKNVVIEIIGVMVEQVKKLCETTG